MKKVVILFMALLCNAIVYGQIDKIVGNWKTVDDKTGNNYALITIYKGDNGLYYGKIIKMLVTENGLICDKCEGEDHNKPKTSTVPWNWHNKNRKAAVLTS